jgi:hypothetical protein
MKKTLNAAVLLGLDTDLYIKFFNTQIEWVVKRSPSDFDSQNPLCEFRNINYTTLFNNIHDMMNIIIENRTIEKDCEATRTTYLTEVALPMIEFEPLRDKIKQIISDFQLKNPEYKWVIITNRK